MKLRLISEIMKHNKFKLFMQTFYFIFSKCLTSFRKEVICSSKRNSVQMKNSSHSDERPASKKRALPKQQPSF